MNSSSFLNQIAKYYIDKQNIENYCFVFPNRRACTFFTQSLIDECHDGVKIMPSVLTMVEFASKLIKARPVAPIESLFTLYKCYCEISENNEYEFDRFVKWGNIILRDFNDVDMAMADAKQLFTNIREYREISTDYLDPELKKKLEKYFNFNYSNALPIAGDDGEPGFWRHYNPEADDYEIKRSYLKLWQQLYDLYSCYRSTLEKRGLTYMGRIYRDAAEYLRKAGADELPWERIVFVGFNMLSTSEVIMFNALEKKGIADFFWDNACPVFMLSNIFPGNEGANYINAYAKMFPMPRDFSLAAIEKLPPIKVVSVPSNIGQAKVAFNLLNNLDNDTINSTSTVIVLPEENLLIPLLNSVPSRVKNINITMGYSMKYSDISSLFRIIAIAQRRVRHNRDKEGVWEFYREDVKDVLSHPIIKRHFSQVAFQITAKIDNENLYYVSQELFERTGLEDLFTVLKEESSPHRVKEYLLKLSQFVDRLQKTINNEKPENDIEYTSTETMPLQSAFYAKMSEGLEYISAAVERHGVPLTGSSILFLLDRLTSSQVVPLEGQPLQGLQIMGMLETRCIDFDNIVILSVNERILPGKYRQQTFISDSLRRVFDLPTMRNNEVMWSYHFYRLLSRAKSVQLVYDSGISQRVGSNEPSRYIRQLRLLYCNPLSIDMTMLHIDSRPHFISSKRLLVNKTPHVMAKINNLLDKNCSSSLSASSINCYFNCQLKYYLQYIEDLGDDERQSDFMKATTFGDIVHHTLNELYYPKNDDGSERNGVYTVTGRMINDFVNKKLDKIIRKQINKHYLYLPDEQLDTPLHGDADINSYAIKEYVLRALRYDLETIGGELGAIDILECEKGRTIQFDLDDDRCFNFYYKPDRIDRIVGTDTVRIIDYKTGGDNTKIKSLEALFDSQDYFKRPHAALQILLYCHAYAKEKSFEGSIKPMIFKLQNMTDTGLYYNINTTDKPRYRQVDDYREIDGFWNYFINLMKQFFNPMEPFMQLVLKEQDDKSSTTKDYSVTTCDYCPFTDICSR